MATKTQKTATARNALLSRMQTAPVSNVAAIRKLVSEQLDADIKALSAKAAAEAELNAARKASYGVRAAIMIALGEAAAKASPAWSEEDIAAGVTEALIPYCKARN